MQRLGGAHLVVAAAVGRVHGELEVDLVAAAELRAGLLHRVVARDSIPDWLIFMILSRSPICAPGLIACLAVPFILSMKPTLFSFLEENR